MYIPYQIELKSAHDLPERGKGVVFFHFSEGLFANWGPPNGVGFLLLLEHQDLNLVIPAYFTPNIPCTLTRLIG